MLEPVTESLTPDTVGSHSQRGTEQVPSATALPDLLLIERARSKEIRAFETLMRRYNQRLFRIARSIVPDGDVAAMVLQEAYLLAFSDIERYEPTGKFGSWLARLAFNQALALRRTLRLGAPAPRVADGHASEEARDIEEGPSRQLLEQAIDDLPEVFRTVFVLRTVEGISGIETAACLGINETTVRTRLYRAQRRVHTDLSRRIPVERAEIFELTADRADYIVNRVLARLNGAARSQQET
ncbi:MAG: polymerase sigma factor [Gammaproteobacteria bacterium]|nr:polymerase sigma factor [Gammaproteobacteria bacterium]